MRRKRKPTEFGGDGRIGHLIIESIDITELVSSRDQAGLRSPLFKRASSKQLGDQMRGALRNAGTRTALNPYTSEINRIETFHAAHELTSGLDSRGIQRLSDIVV